MRHESDPRSLRRAQAIGSQCARANFHWRSCRFKRRNGGFPDFLQPPEKFISPPVCFSEPSVHQMAPGGVIAHSSSSVPIKWLSALPEPSRTRGHTSALVLLSFVFLLRLATPALRLGVLGSWQRSESYVFLRRYGRRSGQPSSSSLARRACVHVLPSMHSACVLCVRRSLVFVLLKFVYWLFLKGSQAPLASPEAEGRWQWRSLRSLALPSFVARFAPVVRSRQMLSLFGPCTAMFH